MIHHLFDGASTYLYDAYWRERWGTRQPMRFSVRRIRARLPVGSWPCFVALYGMTTRGDLDVDVEQLRLVVLDGRQSPNEVRTPMEFDYEMSDEPQTPEVADQLLGLVAPAFPGVGLTDRTWTKQPPRWRCLARDGDEIIGQQAVVALSVDCDRVMGLSDLVVAPQYRNLGVARRLIESALSEIWRRGADYVVAATEREPVLTVLRDWSFCRAAKGQFYYLEDGQERTIGSWWYSTRADVGEPTREQLVGDF